MAKTLSATTPQKAEGEIIPTPIADDTTAYRQVVATLAAGFISGELSRHKAYDRLSLDAAAIIKTITPLAEAIMEINQHD